MTASFFCCIIEVGGKTMYKHRVEIRDGEAIIVGHLYIPDEESDRPCVVISHEPEGHIRFLHMTFRAPATGAVRGEIPGK